MAKLLPLRRKKNTEVLRIGLVLQFQVRMTATIAALEKFNNSYYNEDIRTLCTQGKLKEAVNILHATDLPTESSTYVCLLQSCIKKKALSEGRLVHAHMSARGFVRDKIVLNTLINAYAKCGSLLDARKVFEEMCEQNVISWTSMISAYASQGQAEEALGLFRRMQRMGVQPNHFTVATVLPACAKLTALEQGMEIHEEIIRRGFQSDVFVGNALVDMYAKCGSIENARNVFDKMLQRDVVSWTSMIASCEQNGHVDEALELFYRMQLLGVRPNMKTFTSAVSACANLRALEQGEEIHEEVIRSGFQSNCFVGNALVDMYAKCGSIEKARYVFDRMLQRDVVSWNVMIAGYAMHGFGRQAIQLFEQMLQFGISPEHETFVGVLSACCHAGLVDEGWRYFYCMSQYYHITPTVEHYGCMVDLIGRAGHLDEAQDFINKMPMEPDAAVWGALLGACRIHTNVEIGEYAAEQLLELNPKSVTPYVMLSVIYAAAGRLAEIEKLRKMVKNRIVKKKPGCSWIIVNKQVNAFLAGDKSHPQTEKINAELEKLAEKMKAAGYAPETTYLLIT